MAGRFNLNSIMAPIGKPMSIGGLGGGMDFDTSQFLTKNDMPMAFDPSQLESQIGGLQKQIGNIPSFDDSAIRKMIEDNQRSIGKIPSFDPSQLQNRLNTLEGRELPQFNPQDYRDDFLSIAREGIQMPEYKAPDLSGFARKEDLPSIDTSQFLTKNDMPRFDPRDYRDDFLSIAREGIQMPEFKAPDLSGFARKEDIPSFDRDKLIEDIRGGINIPQAPAFDRQKLIEDIRGGIDIPQAPDLSAFDTRFSDMQKRIDELSQRQAPQPTGGPFLDTSLIPEREVLQRPIIPPRRDDFMSIERIDEDQRIPRMTNEEPVLFTPPPSPVVETVQPAPTEPAAVATTAGADPTQTQMPMGAIDPVLLQQATSEKLTDPLLRSLYFGTQDSPGFYQQLQQAGSNLIGSDVPLQQTAGLSPLELLARQKAVAGLGGFEPFLQQNRDLVNQGIAQSRRAEQLQDPYYTQAEEIYKDTMGAYDPSMTQQFYNPYEDAVVQQTIDDTLKAGDKQDIASRAREISSGAFGGSRARLGAEERRESLGRGLAQALGNIRSQGYQTAQSTGLGEFARQQQAKRTGAQGLMGIGVGRGSAASQLGSQLAGYGSQIGGIGQTQEQMRSGQRGELSGYGGTGRGIAETGLGRIYQQQLGQQQRPLGVLGQIGSMLPGYQASQTQIDSGYGMPTDPTAAGLGAAFSAYGALAPRQGQT